MILKGININTDRKLRREFISIKRITTIFFLSNRLAIVNIIIISVGKSRIHNIFFIRPIVGLSNTADTVLRL
jgi:hypothetical protein